MNVTTVHLIRLADLDRAMSTPPGMRARIDLGDVDYVDLSAGHRLCHLTWSAASVEIVGATPRILDHLAAAIVAYADQVAS